MAEEENTYTNDAHFSPPIDDLTGEVGERRSTLELSSGYLLDISDDSEQIDFSLRGQSGSAVLGRATVIIDGQSAIVYDLNVTGGERSSGIGTEVYKGLLLYIQDRYASVNSFLSSAVHPHIASIFARNVPEGWEATFRDSQGRVFLPAELLADELFIEVKQYPRPILLNFRMERGLKK